MRSTVFHFELSRRRATRSIARARAGDGVAAARAASSADARTLQQARDTSTRWNERYQNADGSWGSGATRPLATAEALLGLARAGRAGAPPAQRGIAWLRSRALVPVDDRARRVRALVACGVDASGGT